MKTINFFAISFLLMSFSSVSFCQENESSGVYGYVNQMTANDIDTNLIMMLNYQLTASENSKREIRLAFDYAQYEAAYFDWEAKADKTALSQYRRGVYFFAKGIETDGNEYFEKALPLLREAAKNNIENENILPAATMAAACENTSGRRQIVADLKKAAKNNAASNNEKNLKLKITGEN